MSDSNKMSSPYVVLENRPLDQWKVIELKEELKKRKLAVRGLKEDLVKRLDEAVRAEIDDAKKNSENDLNGEAPPEAQFDDESVTEKTTNVMDHTCGKNEGLEKDNMIEDLDNENDDKRDVQTAMGVAEGDDGLPPLAEKMVTESESGALSTCVESVQVVQETSVEVETSVLASEGTVSKELGVQESQTVQNQNKDGISNQLPQNEETKSESLSLEEEQTKLDSSHLSSGRQVVEVSQVQFDSVSIDTISNTEKNELKDNVIADNVKLEVDVKPDTVHPSFTDVVLVDSKSESVEVDEPLKDQAPAEEKDVNNAENEDLCKEVTDIKLVLDVKPEKVEPSFINVVLDGGKSDSVEVDEPHKDKAISEEKYVNNSESVDICKKNDSGDVGSSEKLNLDRSSGDDSMEEDALESKQIDSKLSSEEAVDRSEKIEVALVKEDDSVDVMVEDATADKNFGNLEDKTGPSVSSTKRKPHDQEVSETGEIAKRQRRWNSEALKAPKHHITNNSAPPTPKDAFQPPADRTSESTVGQELPKERVVPPSSKPLTTSLRIDHFLRPFTLKAVQELLGKTGTVVNFWMDPIKTHCFVTYASVEEAIETRNAVYDLQWPVNGGRHLVADFVDPQEVKNRVDPPPPSPVSTTPPAAVQPPQSSPRQQLPPPPSLPPAAAAAAARVPPPEKVDPPIVTLDDLFRKTRATPRIYYLPLSDGQVAAKLNAE